MKESLATSTSPAGMDAEHEIHSLEEKKPDGETALIEEEKAPRFEELMLHPRVGPALAGFLTLREFLNVMQLRHAIHEKIRNWDCGLARGLCEKVAAECRARVREAQAKINEERAQMALLRKG